MMLARRGLIGAALCAPAIIRPGLLMRLSRPTKVLPVFKMISEYQIYSDPLENEILTITSPLALKLLGTYCVEFECAKRAIADDIMNTTNGSPLDDPRAS